MHSGRKSYGLLLRLDDDALDPHSSELSGSPSPTRPRRRRLQELVDGGEELSDEERALWIDLNAEDAFENPEGEAWEIVPLQKQDEGTRAFAAQLLSGDSWSGVDLEFLGVFPTVAAARQARAAGRLHIS